MRFLPTNACVLLKWDPSLFLMNDVERDLYRLAPAHYRLPWILSVLWRWTPSLPMIPCFRSTRELVWFDMACQTHNGYLQQ